MAHLETRFLVILAQDRSHSGRSIRVGSLGRRAVDIHRLAFAGCLLAGCLLRTSLLVSFNLRLDCRLRLRVFDLLCPGLKKILEDGGMRTALALLCLLLRLLQLELFSRGHGILQKM